MRCRKAKQFAALAANLVAAIDDVFRVQEVAMEGTIDGIWFDYDLAEHRLRKRFYPSNLFPLLLLQSETAEWNGSLPSSSPIDNARGKNCARTLAYLEATGALGFKG